MAALAPQTAVLYEVNITFAKSVQAEADVIMNGSVFQDLLSLPGCFFTHVEIWKAEEPSSDKFGTDAISYIIHAHCTNRDGLTNYLKNHASQIRAVLEPVAATTDVSRRNLIKYNKILPSNRANFSYSRPSTANTEPKVFDSKRRVHSSVFDGALGLKSSEIETTTNRFTDFQVHKAGVQTYRDSAKISRAADVEARFYLNQEHKKAPVLPSDGLGISTKQMDYRNPTNRFEHGGKHFGQLNPNAGPGVVAGVTAAKQPHEIDRFDNPIQHRGQLNPNAGPGVVAGVTAAKQPHEIDRFDNPIQHRGQLNPNAGSEPVAGVEEKNEPHEIDRFDNPIEHHGGAVAVNGDSVAAGVTSAQEPAAKEIDRFQIGAHEAHAAASRPSTGNRVRQPPGGVSTFTFG